MASYSYRECVRVCVRVCVLQEGPGACLINMGKTNDEGRGVRGVLGVKQASTSRGTPLTIPSTNQTVSPLTCNMQA